MIGLIDRFGLRHRFNRWLFQQAAQVLHELRMEGLEIDISINLSATDLYDAEVPDLIGQALSTWNLEAGRLCLEITETSMMDERSGSSVSRCSTLAPARCRPVDRRLRHRLPGMSRLRRLAVQEVKIDRSFVIDLLASARDREIAAAIIDLSHRPRHRGHCRGRGGRSHRQLLAGMGCDYIRGFRRLALPLTDFVARCALANASAGSRCKPDHDQFKHGPIR